MSSLADFVSTLGFKMDGSFDAAMKTIGNRLGTLGKDFSGVGGQLSKSVDAAARRVQVAQMNLQSQALKSEAAKMALSDKLKSKQLSDDMLHAKALQENARRERQSIARDNTIERDKAAAALKYQRVMQQENARITRAATAEMNRIHSEALKENARRGRMDENFRKNIFGGGISAGGIGGIPIMGRTTLGMMAGGFGISEFTRQAYQMANFNAKMMPTLKFATRDEKKSDAENLAAANVEKNYINKEVSRLSLDRVSATQAYQGLLAATYKTLGSQGSQDLFTGVQQVGMMTGRSQDEMHRGFVALQQMASKGRITQEELRGQFSEAIIGGEQIFANALTGGDLKKLSEGIQKGLFGTKDLLKVAAEMKRMVSDKDLAEMMKMPDKMITRMRNSWGDLLTAINNAGFWEMMSTGIESVTEALRELTPVIKEVAPHFKAWIGFIWENKEALAMFYGSWKLISLGMKSFSTAKAAGEIMTLSKSFKLLGLSMLEVLAIPAAIIAAIILAADTMEAFTGHKKGLLWDFRDDKSVGKRQDRNKDLSNHLAGVEGGNWFTRRLNTTQLYGDVDKMRFNGDFDRMGATEKHLTAQRILKGMDTQSNVYDATGAKKFLQDIESEYKSNATRQGEQDKLSRVGGGNTVTINFTGVADPAAIEKQILPVVRDTLRGENQREQAGFPNMLLR